MLGRAVRRCCLAPALLLVASAWGCDEERDPVLAFPGGGTGGTGGAGGAGGQSPCPPSLPADGAPCEGERTCGYRMPTGCSTQTLTTRCVDGKWRSTNASANAIPALPNCPFSPPAHGSVCGVQPSPCGTFPLNCSWVLPGCQMPVTGSCLQGTWSVSECQTLGAGGAGGEGGAGGAGAGGEDGFGGAAGGVGGAP